MRARRVLVGVLAVLLVPLAGTFAAADEHDRRGGADGDTPTHLSLDPSRAPALGSPVQARGGRIVGGVDTDLTSVPWQVWYQTEIAGFFYSCGGSAVAPRVIVTAAHCFFDADGNPATGATVISGVSDLDDATQSDVSEALDVWIHPRYDAPSSRNDIAVMLVERNLPGVSLIKLNRSSGGPAFGTDLLISGWGATSFGGSAPDQLQSAVVEVLAGPGQPCGSYGNAFFPALMLCGGVQGGGIDTCQGDSGGPAVIEVGGSVRLAGVTSFGNGCAEADFPGVYTRVSKYHRLVTSISYFLGIERSGRRAELFWERPATDRRVVDYRIQYRVRRSDPWQTIDDDRTAAPGVTVTGLNANRTYQFRVIAIQKGNVAAPASTVVSG
jgi:hypothetical protein